MFKSFIIALLKGFWFIAVLTIGSVQGIFQGIWAESDDLARLWMYQLTLQRKGGALTLPLTFEHPIYHIMRWFACVMQLVDLMIVFHIIWLVIKRSLGI